jgi:hypothetical protein
MQFVPHCPQLPVSLIRSAHDVPQLVVPVGQPHVPAWHDVGALHALPQRPQLAASRSGSTHAFAHTIAPVPGHWHRPETHAPPVGHAVPHWPQWAVSEEVSVHWPLQGV